MQGYTGSAASISALLSSRGGDTVSSVIGYQVLTGDVPAASLTVDQKLPTTDSLPLRGAPAPVPLQVSVASLTDGKIMVSVFLSSGGPLRWQSRMRVHTLKLWAMSCTFTMLLAAYLCKTSVPGCRRLPGGAILYLKSICTIRMTPGVANFCASSVTNPKRR